MAKIIKDVKGMEKFAKEAAECKDPADKWEEQVGDFSKRMSAKVVVLEKVQKPRSEQTKVAQRRVNTHRNRRPTRHTSARPAPRTAPAATRRKCGAAR